MLLTISTTYQPATDLGFLLHKHPGRLQSVDISVGKAHLFYPVANEAQCSICLLLDIDPIAMVRGARNMGSDGFSLGHYVNDRPYVASSFMSVAIAKAFSSAMNGRCKDKPELVDQKIPFEVKIATLPAPKGGEELIRNLFEPLGYVVILKGHELDPQFPDWGQSKYFTVELKHQVTTQELLSHLYVLIPVLDNDKHYFVSKHEIDKLLDKGKGWLKDHPEREQIIGRYLFNLKFLKREALERISEGEDAEVDEAEEPEQVEKLKKSLHQQRLELVLEKLIKSGAEKVLDLGCGEGKLLRLLLKKRQFTQITGMDVSYKELIKAKDRMHWDEMAPKQKERIALFQGALTYQDKRLEGFDAAAIVEVIEHLDPDRLKAFERVVFEFAKPKTVILTTPNAEYNVVFESLDADSFRHSDHRFEWTRKEFQEWAEKVAEEYHYAVSFFPVGEEKEEVGAPSQMVVFRTG